MSDDSLCHCHAMPFGMKWLGYLMVKNFEDTFIRFDTIHKRDGHTDTTLKAKAALDARIAWQKLVSIASTIKQAITMVHGAQ